MAGFFFNGKFLEHKDSLKYVNDYTTELYEDEKGKTRERTTYVGPMIKFRDDPKSVKTKLIVSTVLTCLMACALVYSVMMNHASAWWGFTVIPMAVAAFPALYMVMGALNFQFDAVPMKRDRYMRSIIRVFKSSAAVIVCYVVGLIADVVYRAVFDDWLFLSEDILFATLSITVIVLSAIVILILRSLNVDERELTK